jgi:putative Mn2+ efflux pump MntP
MPHLLDTIGIALGVAMDAFAVAIATSVALRRVRPRQVFRLSFHFGLFQALMPVLGWLLGRSFSLYIQAYDHWVAFALLAFIGGRALYEVHNDKSGGKPKNAGKDPTRGLNLVLLSVATSIDALAVGLAFSMLEMVIWLPVLIIGLVTAAMTVLGMHIGAAVGLRFSRRVEFAGGLILIGIGVKIVIDHVWLNGG